MKKLFAIIVIASLAGCSAPERAKRVLDNSGYTEIEITGYSPFSCGEDDTFSTGFKAKNANGKVVEGTVCSGWFKDGTVRF